MPNITFTDNTAQIVGLLEQEAVAFLYEMGGELQTTVTRASRNATGQTKNAWELVVDESNLTATVGNPMENAIWEEFGTGEYAINGDGRQTPWKYEDKNGKWHTTTGKKPNRTLTRAFEKMKPKIARRLQEIIGER